VPRKLSPAIAVVLVLCAGCGSREAPRALLHDLTVELPLLTTTGPPPTLAALAGGLPALRLPAGSALSTVVELDGPAVLDHGGWRAVGDAELEIVAELESGAPQRLASGASSTAAAALELPGTGRRLVAIHLRSTGSGEIVLVRPRILGRAPASPPPPAPRSAASAARVRPNVLIVLVDTLRRDRLGSYGCVRGLTPRIDAFAAESTVFDEAVAQASWTRPSVTSIFTGLFPQGHGVTGLETSLAPAATTLAELLHDAGYFTAAVSTNYHVTKETGLRQGFQRFVLIPEATGSEVVRKGLDLLAARPADDRGRTCSTSTCSTRMRRTTRRPICASASHPTCAPRPDRGATSGRPTPRGDGAGRAASRRSIGSTTPRSPPPTARSAS
jgi:hypothetical protein